VHVATLVRRLEAPPKKVVLAVSLSRNGAPTVCAIWRAEPPDATPGELRCYPPAWDFGKVISTKAGRGVGVRPGGGAVAWTENSNNPDLVVTDLEGETPKELSRAHYAPTTPNGGLPSGLAEVDWVGPRWVGVTDVADSDEGNGLCLVDLDKARPKTQVGFTPCLQPGAADRRSGYSRFEQAAPGSGTSDVITIERAQYCFCDDDARAPGARAVRVSAADGAVLEVVATPRAGRDVIDISGSARAVLYVTAQQGSDRTVSLRWAGETRGAPLTGLPADLLLATAQP
jgi:hypothetical protein